MKNLIIYKKIIKNEKIKNIFKKLKYRSHKK